MVVDQFVLNGFRRCGLGLDHGRRDNERHGILLTRAGQEVLIDVYE
ncbi:hypothetical protein GCM10017566_45640 [Amycolatopsis bartoniae]|uniref:Uncharacterized protein n=1 Tax=Amycolatopsis bartoniae TaxID=941986 RepID=A0A8H9IYS6_9PSEU|nr:hypothetical protein GCM10017566_45640 [Amycolatopsis bartoniae]